MSKAGKPLTRYFPELVEMLRQVRAKRFVLDGEIVVPKDGELSFDELLLRIHPAASRVTKLRDREPRVAHRLRPARRGRHEPPALVEEDGAGRGRALVEGEDVAGHGAGA